MCNSGGDRASPPAEAVRLRLLESAPEEQRRPQSSKPQSRHGERTTSRHGERTPSRAASKHGDRPPSSRHGERPSSSKARPSTSASTSRKGDRPNSRSRPSSSREHISKHRDESARRARFEAIPEDAVQYPEDQAILRSAAELATMTEQHADNFYSPDEYHGDDSELSDPRTRKALIRQRIAKTIIAEVAMSNSNRSDEALRGVAARLAAEFHDYSYSDSQVQRENHLCELASIGGELRELISSHPSSWDFGTFDDVKGRYIVVFPTLLRDDEQAAARRIFRI